MHTYSTELTHLWGMCLHRVRWLKAEGTLKSHSQAAGCLCCSVISMFRAATHGSAGKGSVINSLNNNKTSHHPPPTHTHTHTHTQYSSQSPERWLRPACWVLLEVSWPLGVDRSRRMDMVDGWTKCNRDAEQSWVSDMLPEDHLPADGTEEQSNPTKGKYSWSNLRQNQLIFTTHSCCSGHLFYASQNIEISLCAGC